MQTIATNEYMGAVIGKRGATINEIEESSGAKVHLNKTSESNMATVSGTADQVANAIAQIRAIIASRTARAPHHQHQHMRVRHVLVLMARRPVGRATPTPSSRPLVLVVRVMRVLVQVRVLVLVDHCGNRLWMEMGAAVGGTVLACPTVLGP